MVHIGILCHGAGLEWLVPDDAELRAAGHHNLPLDAKRHLKVVPQARCGDDDHVELFQQRRADGDGRLHASARTLADLALSGSDGNCR